MSSAGNTVWVGLQDGTGREGQTRQAVVSYKKMVPPLFSFPQFASLLPSCFVIDANEQVLKIGDGANLLDSCRVVLGFSVNCFG